ncbi:MULTISPECIES: hypothetical protein [Actinomadura]|uniref:HTTM-like domain-containing protein n=1 Tax=Actinomadura yumaensis TaxID=111807 RepID=A0ABW2CK97_9ACTN|nr:hypothetical protein [Actinomadura sp. J1-007]MWK36927.1 hypothetical protein [Actinomadura sp. J1-007]
MTALPVFLRRAEHRHRRLIGAALFRIVLGVSGLEFYLSSYPDRRLLWGPRGYLPHEAFHRLVEPDWSLYGLNGSTPYFEVLFHLGLAVAAAYTVIGGRLLTAAHFVLLASLYMRSPQALDHAHVLARIMLPFSVATVTDAYLSPFARRRRARLRRAEARPPSVSAMAHNCALFLMVFQTSAVYLMAGLWKVLDPDWRNGTAAYYVVHSGLSDTGPVAALAALWPVTTPLTYGTVALEIGFPFLAASRRRRVRLALLSAAVSLHVAIAVSTPLLNFCLVMIACDLLVPRDGDYRSLRRGGWRNHLRRGPRPRERASAEAPSKGPSLPAPRRASPSETPEPHNP